MKYSSIMRSFIIVCTMGAFYSQTLCSFTDYIFFWRKKQAQDTLTKEYAIAPESMVTLTAKHGSITVQSWDQPKVQLKMTKKVDSQEQLPLLGMNDLATPHSLTITSAESEQVTNASIDYKLMVPRNASLSLATHTGSITIDGITKGKISATTADGNIVIKQSHGTVVAQVSNDGSITIEEAKGSVRSTTHYGDITIAQSYNTVVATSNQGSIDLKAAAVPSTATIKLSAHIGLITAQLPKDTNADLLACTHKGSIFSEHAVTLKPRTTTLDQKAWRQFKAQVDGILGSGEATIVLTTHRGNIKILDSKIA